jgi:uncharacterized membrane protein
MVAAASTGALVSRAYATSFMLVVPGALVVDLLGLDAGGGLARVGYAAAASTTLLMAEAWGASLLGPSVGIARPLEHEPLTLIVSVTTVILLLAAARRGDPLARLVGPGRPSSIRAIVAICIAAVPVAAAAGTELINNHDSSVVTIVAFVGAGLLLLLVLLLPDRLPVWAPSGSLYAAGAAMLLSFSLRGGNLFGFDIQLEYQALSTTMSAGIWRPPANGDAYRAMLSITALPTLLSKVGGVSGLYLFKEAVPLLFALFPVLVYEFVRRYAAVRPAFVAAALLVVLPQFSEEMSAVVRQEIALLIFAVMISVAFDDRLPAGKRTAATILAGLGVVASHYSTAYTTLGLLVATYVLYGLLRLGRPDARRPAFNLVIVGSFAVAALLWNVTYTHSTGNVRDLGDSTSSQGLLVLPGSNGQSLLTRWINGPEAVGHDTASLFYARARASFEQHQRYAELYPDSVTAAFPGQDATVPAVPARIKGIAPAESDLNTLGTELVLAAIGLASLTYVWRRARRRDREGAELAVACIVFLTFLAVMRVSGTVAAAYNPERGQVNAMPVLAVPLALAIGWTLAHGRAIVTLGLAGLVAVQFAVAAGLAALVVGGTAPANLFNYGEGFERFFITDQEVATARWLSAEAGPHAIIYTDQYGELPVWEGTSIGAPLTVVTPGTVGRYGWVFASSPNVVDGRARGEIAGAAATYVFPTFFLDAKKNLVFTTGTTRVYR